MGLAQSIKDMNRTKKLSKEEFLSPDYFELDIVFFFYPVFGLELKHQFVLGLQPAGFQSGTTHWLPYVSSLLTADLGTS